MVEQARYLPCNLCGGNAPRPLFTTHDRLLDTPEPYHFVQCAQCGLIYVDPQPVWAERAAHYPAAYRGYHAPATGGAVLQRQGMAVGFAKRYRLIAEHLTQSPVAGRLLDIGCGNGDFLDWLAPQPGWRVVGIDRNPAVVPTLSATAEWPLVAGDTLDLPFAAGTFDVVTLWSVLEHLADPAQALAECVRVLRLGGLLVVRTVNSESWGCRFFGPNWIGYDAPRVLFVFSTTTLDQLLRQSGCEPVVSGHYFHDFYPFLWSLHNCCHERLGNRALCTTLDQYAHSWPVRLLTWPFFARLTSRGENSFVTTIARKVCD